MNRGFDVAVVGAGIVGLGAAYAAVRRGQSVVVIERTPEALGATVRNFGHLCIGAQMGLAREYADASRPLWLRLARDAGFWLRESGTLVVARHSDELALLEAAAGDGGIELLDRREFETRAFGAPGHRGGRRVGPRPTCRPTRERRRPPSARISRRSASSSAPAPRSAPSRRGASTRPEAPSTPGWSSSP